MANILILTAFLVNTFGPWPCAQAQDFSLPVAGVMVHLSPEFNPPILKGLKVHTDNPFRFDFILDQGDVLKGTVPLKQEAIKLIKYFLASLTIPEKDLWVNLSPYEKNRIIPNSFGLTEMGRDLLVEDYMLKQITASLIYPEDPIGKKFWKRIYEEAARKFGTTNVPVNTFNKVWILPDKAVVYENAKAGTAYVVESKLKVMLEEDYLALSKHVSLRGTGHVSLRGAEGDEAIFSLKGTAPLNALGSEILREVVIPELTKEVNENKNFAKLRQVYNSLILATWYKKKIKDSILEQVYADRNKIAGVGYEKFLSSPNVLIGDPQYIYQQYLKAFKKGVYNYIKEEQDPVRHEVIPRKYFSGGVELDLTIKADAAMKIITHLKPSQIVFGRSMYQVTSDFAQASEKSFNNDSAMAADDKKLQWQRFIAPAGDRQLWGRKVELSKEKAFELGDLVYVSKGKFQKSFVFPGETKGRLRSHTMGYGVTGIRCTAITYDKQGQVVGLRFEGIKKDHIKAKITWGRGSHGTWMADRKDVGAKRFIEDHPNIQDALASAIEKAEEPAREFDEAEGPVNGNVNGSGNGERGFDAAMMPPALEAELIKRAPLLGRLSPEDRQGLMQGYQNRFKAMRIDWQTIKQGLLTKEDWFKSHERRRVWSVYLSTGKVANETSTTTESYMVFEFIDPFPVLSDIDHPKAGEVYSDLRRYIPIVWRHIDLRKHRPSRVLVQGDPVQINGIKRALEDGGLNIPVVSMKDAEILPHAMYHKRRLGSVLDIVETGAINSLGDLGFERLIKNVLYSKPISYTQEELIQAARALMDIDSINEAIAGDRAMGAKGGIDLTPANMNLQTKNSGSEIKFHIDSAQLAQLQNAPGFVPVIIDIQPMKDLAAWLGVGHLDVV